MKTIDYFLLFLSLLFIGVMIYIMLFLKSDNAKCVINPLEYSMVKLEKANNASIVCSCNVLKPNGPQFSLTKNGIKVNSYLTDLLNTT